MLTDVAENSFVKSDKNAESFERKYRDRGGQDARQF